MVDPEPLFALDDSFARELVGLYEPWAGAVAPAPRALIVNDEFAGELGLDPSRLSSPEGALALTGTVVPAGAAPIAQAYAGHQFGGFSPRLGDGRALLLGELLGPDGLRRDLHLKGSGRTPFARGGDGKAAVGPMLREYVIGEAMHALGIPTTRALGVFATGERIARDTMVPGAVLARVASSHLRVGTFQYAAAHLGPESVQRLADYAIDRHYAECRNASNPYLAFLSAVADAQAGLIARWMLVGFVHGVMNTDNMTISGETIDYGPCAFMDRFDPATVFSSIDHDGRYAYGNQPGIAQWNLARLAETLLPLIDPDTDRAVAAATDVLQRFVSTYSVAWLDGMRVKLGLTTADETDADLVDRLLTLLKERRVDYTSFFRRLSGAAVGDEAPVRALFDDTDEFDAWSASWNARLASDGQLPRAVATSMDRANPLYVPRNHLVEAALTAASDGDLAPLHTLLDAVTRPFEERTGLEAYAEPAPPDAVRYRTFCGT